MFHIAVCDADRIFCAYAEQCIYDYGMKTGSKFSVDTFGRAEELCAHLWENNPVDLVFLGVQMSGMSGIEAAGKIRRELGLESLPIVFVSTQTSDAMSLFSLHPQDFLIKPVDAPQIQHEIELCMRLLGVPGKYFICTENRRTRRIPVVSIKYLESHGHKVLLTHTGGHVWFYGKLDSAMTQFEGSSRFVRVHKSFIINTDYSEQYTGDAVTMMDGRMIPVSQRCKAKERLKKILSETNRIISFVN